jgi:signal transduction histidine kinase
MRGQEAVKQWLRSHWPRLRLRTILFGVFVFVAALPGLSALFLRVYENTLVRQTESELVAQGAALVAAAGGRFTTAQKPEATYAEVSLTSGASRTFSKTLTPAYYRPEPPRIDLSQDHIEPPRPDPRPSALVAGTSDLAMATMMEPIIAQTSRTTLASIIMTDRQGIILTGVWKGRSYAHIPEVMQAMNGRAVTKLRHYSGYRARYSFEWLSRAASVRVHHVRPIIIDRHVVGVILLSRSSRALFRGMYEDRGKIMLGVGLILAILVLLTFLLHRTIAKPIEALSTATRRVAAGQGDIPDPPATAAQEIRALYRDFGDMSGAITQRSRYLRDFAAALSHEFKTPLAGIRGAIELIEDHHGSMSEKQRRQFMGNISSDAERLSALVGRLLDLARADMARPEAGASSDIAPIVRRVADALQMPSFELKHEALEKLPPVAVPEMALESVIMGLAENSRQAGASQMILAATLSDKSLVLRLSDDGPGISGADQDRLFEPFFTTRRSEGGTGLGLAINRSLIEANRGTIDFVPTKQGATFELRLPIA